MSSFSWDECFVTGLGEVDQQHQLLVGLINRFSDLMLGESAVHTEAITTALDELSAYAVFHFQEEERLMREGGLDPRARREHEAMHHAFVGEVTNMRAILVRAGGGQGEAQHLLDFLVHWLAHHILGADQAMARLESAWDEATRHNELLAVMMLDADHFKAINDRFGHDAGDEVLRALSRTLRNAMRTDDLVFRLGGDEFFILCRRTGMDGALQAAEQVRAAVAALHVIVRGGTWDGSVSVGVAVNTPGMVDPSALVKAADEALYEAKRRGRNCVAASSGAGGGPGPGASRMGVAS